MSSLGEGRPENLSKRKFLEAAVAGVLAVSGIRPEKAEAASAREREKLIEKVKNENTIIELEKKLLKELNDDDINKINSGDITAAEKIVRDKYGARFREAIVAAVAVVAAGAASGLVYDHQKQHVKELKYEEGDFFKTIMGTVAGGLLAGVIIFAQPKVEHVGAAENNLIIEWLTPIKQSGGVISKESIEERIENLTERQKSNSARVSGK